jgi:hypothetical protein
MTAVSDKYELMQAWRRYLIMCKLETQNLCADLGFAGILELSGHWTPTLGDDQNLIKRLAFISTILRLVHVHPEFLALWELRSMPRGGFE